MARWITLTPIEDIQAEAIRRLAERHHQRRMLAAGKTPTSLAMAQRHRQQYPLAQFVEEAWPYIEPQRFVDGWHIQAICEHLQAVTETATATDDVPSLLPDIRNLLINIPPRSSKSLVCSVLWPAWVWLSWPSCRWMYASYNKDLALRDAVYARTLMSTGWYRDCCLLPWEFTTDQRVKSFYANSRQGYRITTSVSAQATGFGGDIRCLPGNALILTRAGWHAIQDMVEAGHPCEVASYDHETRQRVWCRVIAYHRTTYAVLPPPYLMLTLDNGVSLSMTENHPVWILERGYTPVGEVFAGDTVLWTATEGVPRPVRVKLVQPGLATTHGIRDTTCVYNLTVAGAQNYWADGVLVHNCGDDLHATQEDFSTSRADILNAKQFWFTTMASRYNDAKRSCQVLVGQRVASDDVSAEAIKQGDYAYLKIPMEYAPAHAAPPTPLGWTDPRTTEGELLSPERFGPDEIASLKARLRHRYFTQFQQRPVTELTSLFPRSKWRHFHVWPDPGWFDVLIQSWDYRFGETKQAGSFVAGHLWGRKGSPEHGHVYLLDRVFARLSFLESVKETKKLSDKWPGAYAKLIEQAANGQAIYETLRSQVFGLRLVPVGGKWSSKLARAEAEAFVLDAGRAWLPHPTLAAWVEAYMDHMEQFPAEPQDDTDATSQAWAYLCSPPPVKNTVREELQADAALARQLHAAQRSRTVRAVGPGRRRL